MRVFYFPNWALFFSGQILLHLQTKIQAKKYGYNWIIDPGAKYDQTLSNAVVDRRHCFLTIVSNENNVHFRHSDDHLQKLFQVNSIFHHNSDKLDQRFLSYKYGMYWNNPLEQVRYPSPSDIIFKATHGGQHCLFWNPCAKFNNIPTNQTLQDLCNWANNHVRNQGIDKFFANDANHYDIANLVKLNMWIHDIRCQGIVKPWLIQDPGNSKLMVGNGDSRLRCLERIPEIQSVPAFISTHSNRANFYTHLELIHTFERFAELCNAEIDQEFLFRLTDADAPYGLDWYEYDSSRTRAVTPGQPEAVNTLKNYFDQHPGTHITPEWFDVLVDWEAYQNF